MVNFLAPDFTDLPGRRTVPRRYQRSACTVERVDVSVITPYYNTEEFFVETVVSLQAQSLQNWEWIIADDGSTDEKSVERIREVAARDQRIKVIRQANAGPGAARNTAYRHSTGRYVCLLDSDDMLEPTYLEKCVWFLDSNPEFAFCNSYSVLFGDWQFLLTAGFEVGKGHVKKNIGPPISVIRRAAYADCGGFDESIRFGHEDWDFWLAMAKAGHWGYTIKEFLQWYRKRGNGRFEQIMRTDNVNADFEASIKLKFDGLAEHFPEPCRRHPLPFETLETKASVSNPLAANSNGRRIMFIVPWMVTGGADRVNLELIEGLIGKGHDITVCATLLADHNWEHQFTALTPDVFVLPNFLHQVDYPRFLAYLIQSRQIDTVLITGSTIGYQLLPYLRAVSPGVAFVDMCHVEEPHWLNGGHPRFGVGYQDALDLNIVTTGHLAAWMQGRGADRERIRVMYTGLKSSQTPASREVRSRLREELNIPAELPVIVFAGRICTQKRPALLAEILAALRDHGLEFRALVIGDGELRGELESLLSQYKLSTCVQMLGTVAHQRWLDVLVAADVFLMPSQYEGISIALLESMAAGVVPVVARVGGQEEIVSDDAGVLIPHGDNEIQEYVSALAQLLSNSSLLRSMSIQCKALSFSKLSWESTIENLQTILDEAHQLRLNQPRHAISLGMGKELATLALEYKRLNDAVDWLWRSQDGQASANSNAVPIPINALARLWTLLSSTRLGSALLRSRRLRALAQWFLAKLEARHHSAGSP
jgi:glycosyltransferase involved in cell wall biosynthesis